MAATATDLRRHLKTLGLGRVVIVQPSPYGADNACTLAALARLGDRARAVAVIDEGADLEELHRAGVRGVRVNLETESERDPAAAQKRIEETARRVAPLGWHVQVFTKMNLLRGLKPLPIPLVIDHFGLVASPDELPREAYVKLSAPHRLAVDAEPLVRALAAERPDRLLWGSDWPHVPRGKRSPDRVLPFEAIDDAAALRRLEDWLPANVLEKILVENPARLYDFQP